MNKWVFSFAIQINSILVDFNLFYYLFYFVYFVRFKFILKCRCLFCFNLLYFKFLYIFFNSFNLSYFLFFVTYFLFSIIYCYISLTGKILQFRIIFFLDFLSKNYFLQLRLNLHFYKLY